MNHRNKTQVKGSVPCGNPKRFESREVVRMPQDGPVRKKLKANQEGDDSVESETQKHLQTLLQHQTETDVTLTDQFSRHRTFTPATSHAPEVEKLEGIHRFSQYKQVDDLDSRIDYLRHCGLTDEEITLKLKEDLKDKVTLSDSGYGADPQIQKFKHREIQHKIQEKQKDLLLPDSFKGALELSRQAMDLEKTLAARQGKDLSESGIITTRKLFEDTHPDDPINHIPEILEGMERKKERASRRDRRRMRKLERKNQYYAAFAIEEDSASESEGVGDSESNEHSSNGGTNPQNLAASSYEDQSSQSVSSQSTTDPKVLETSSSQQIQDNKKNLAEEPSQLKSPNFPNQNDISLTNDILSSERLVYSESSSAQNNPDSKLRTNNSLKNMREISSPVRLLTKEEILNNRLSLEEIKSKEKFQNYTEGAPNKVVYVKNLPPKTTEEELVALFGFFQSPDKPKIVFKLLSGRMKGQAFITFPDETTAGEAIKLVNGYKLHERPVILSYGKKQ